MEGKKLSRITYDENDFTIHEARGILRAFLRDNETSCNNDSRNFIDLDEGVEAKMIRCLKCLSNKGDTRDEDLIINALQLKQYKWITHFSAMVARDHGMESTVHHIVELISDERYSKFKGGFVYALQTLNWSKYFVKIIGLVSDSIYEHREMAMQALEQCDFEIAGEIQKEALVRMINIEKTETDKEILEYLKCAKERIKMMKCCNE